MVVPMPKSRTNDILGSHRLSYLVNIEERDIKTGKLTSGARLLQRGLMLQMPHYREMIR